MTRKANVQPSSGYKILLADDDVDYLEVTRRLLEREGHLVVTATSGRQALEIMKQQKIDLLFPDFYRPNRTGEQGVSEPRQFNRYIQIILQTGYASEQPPRELLKRLDIQG